MRAEAFNFIRQNISKVKSRRIYANLPKNGLCKIANVFYYFSEVHRFMLAHFHFWASFSRDAHFCPLRQMLCFLHSPEQGGLGAAQRAKDASSHLPFSAARPYCKRFWTQRVDLQAVRTASGLPFGTPGPFLFQKGWLYNKYRLPKIAPIKTEVIDLRMY